MTDLPSRVFIKEEGPREGFQIEKRLIPTTEKIRLVDALSDTGLIISRSLRSFIPARCRAWLMRKRSSPG
jgi:hydroxymethylglutaryl-CoA lyase